LFFDKIGGNINATNVKQRAESTLTVIPPEDITTEQRSVRRLGGEIKAKRKTLDKAHQEAINKLKDEAKEKRKACDKAQKKATKRLKDEGEVKRKALDKVHQGAIKNIKDKAKAKTKPSGRQRRRL
jgi:hypothetical protein